MMEYMDLDFSEYMASQANQLSLPKIKVRVCTHLSFMPSSASSILPYRVSRMDISVHRNPD